MKLISGTTLLAAASVINADSITDAAGGNTISSNTVEGQILTTKILEASCQGDATCLDLVEKLQLLDLEPRGMVSTDPTSLAIRRLKQLKVLILWLQPEYRFARYCFYGCWCLPDADHALNSAGYGKPVDNIDASCKRQSQCYDCAQMDNDNVVCDASTTNYKYELIFDESDPTNHMKKSIKCLDERKDGEKGNSKSGCKRSVCECDKKLAEDLRQYFDEWDIKKHAIQGGFDWEGECERINCTGPGCGHELACCGDLGNGVRMPYRVEGRRQCCGHYTYDSTFFECCSDESVQAIGNC